MVQNKALIYAAHPTSLPEAGKHIKIESRDFDENQTPPSGGITIKVNYVSFDPYQRGRMRPATVKSYAPPFDLGKPVTNSAVATVIKSDNQKFKDGQVIYAGRTNTEEYVALSKEEADACDVLDNQYNLDPKLFVGALGMPGLTAYSSFYAIGKPKKGETIFISAASGAVGQIVGQLAKHEGLKVIGSVGDDSKLDFITKELGFDGGFNYKKEKAGDALERLAPDGIDIYYENVGGEQLEAALTAMKPFGRIVACGMISQYNKPPEEQYGVKNLMQVVGKRITIRGFIVFDPDMGPVYAKEHQKNVQAWIHDGSFKAQMSTTKGIDNAAEGLLGLFAGKNFGKAVLEAITIMDRRRAYWLPTFFFAIFVLGSLIYLRYPHTSTAFEYKSQQDKQAFKAPKHNVFAELTEQEATSVNDFILEKFDHLNLTKHPKSARDNFVYIVETLKPNKTDAVTFLHDDAPPPERWAKASISENFPDGPYMVYYMVGPLPVSEETQILPLEYTFNSGRNYIKNPVQDYGAILDFALEMAEDVSDITQELLGATVNRANPDDPEGLLAFPRGSRVETGGMMLWMQFYRPGMGSGARTLLPQGIYVKVDATSLNTSEWTVGQFYYNGVLYDTAAEFRSALDDPDFQRTPPNLDGSWTNTEDFGDYPDRDLPPPVSVQPYGPRYKLDKKENYISWFGFEFYLTTAQATGVSLFDIRFKGERVMYELGLQEAMAHYAGDDPMQGGLEFMDSFFGMGNNAFELVPGYDCPAYADYLDAEWHRSYQTHTMPNSICIFEFTADYLLSRHTAQYSVTASRNTFLTVRSVSTVGNYDYTIEYMFFMDGTIEVKVRASGFIFSAFYTANSTKSEDEYGHRIHDALSSSMHDHVLNFKADLDVAGPTNDMVRLALEPMTTSYGWDQPEQPKRNTMHLKEYPVTEETGLDWPKNSGEFYIVYNSDEKNAWGERKGYRVTSGTGVGSTPHLTILNSTTLGDSARWAEHDLWVLQRKDNEPRSADPLNYFAPHDPLIDFTKMADHERLEHGAPDTPYDGDLVVYFNLGAHHIPHSGDIPNTLMHTSASSVMFVPHNFADADPSRQSVQGVRLQLKGHGKKSGGFAGEWSAPATPNGDLRSRSQKDNKTKAYYFGATYEKKIELPLEALEPDMEGYVSGEHDITDLSFNGSAAGVWHREEAFGG
ncbi:hypothetical protein LTR86_007069 [Recurvomyces mirabilis]|nr:hypothetical protein LTR86_007069 [Recurvomyces mirabilis]